MADLLTVIKNVVKNYLANENLSDYVFGTIQDGGSLKLDNKPIIIPSDMVVIPNTIESEFEFLEVSKDGKLIMPIGTFQAYIGKKFPVLLKPKYYPGERVIVAVKHGGQRYAIVGRL